ncbi:DNA-binding transcriptional LysR family regulator [Raoultella sp. BIGb0138]|uniref:LysR substrate-binding domain-containing protein n=1 Tax=Raoultella sp. BIGb0138 TaxID=2485115 RepID=UPI00104E1AC6|nr:LysR substrate-binding domain-containing protein [Raoultella sp. BIGb0138]TCW08524.1 DNA-binding transcriptional LysR family regulator [Raoultella sp. BIGb0138]
MELRHLRYFMAVAEEGHFGRAAERLNIVQPALSMQIKALEAELGGALFMRTSRRVELTEAGLLLQAEARRTLEQVEHTRLAVERAIRGETGRVRVGFAGNAIFSGKMIADLRHFRKTYPDAEVVIEEIAPQRQVAAILAGQLDIGYTPDNSTTRSPAIRVHQVGRWEMMVALPDDHPFTAHSRIAVPMLADAPLILYEAHDSHEPLYLMLARMLGTRFHVAHRSASTLSVLAMAAAGLGVALIPAPLQQVSIPGLVYRRLDAPEVMANLVIIGRAEEPGNAVTAWLELATSSKAPPSAATARTAKPAR